MMPPGAFRVLVRDEARCFDRINMGEKKLLSKASPSTRGILSKVAEITLIIFDMIEVIKNNNSL